MFRTKILQAGVISFVLASLVFMLAEISVTTVIPSAVEKSNVIEILKTYAADQPARKFSVLTSETPEPTVFQLFQQSSSNENPKKIILFWTSFFGGPNSFLGEEGVKLKDCPVNSCLLTDDKSMVESSDALIFHPLDMEIDMPTHRQPHQYYIYFGTVYYGSQNSTKIFLIFFLQCWNLLITVQPDPRDFTT